MAFSDNSQHAADPLLAFTWTEYGREHDSLATGWAAPNGTRKFRTGHGPTPLDEIGCHQVPGSHATVVTLQMVRLFLP